MAEVSPRWWGFAPVILVIFFLYQTRPVFAPLAFALLVIAIVWPIQRALQTKLPKLVALALSMLVTFFIVALFVSLIAWGFGRVARYIISDAAHFQALYNLAVLWLEQHGIVVASLWAEYFNMSWLIRIFQELLGTINSTLSFSVIVLIYVMLGLLEVDVVARKLETMKNQAVGQALLTGAGEIAVKLRRYMAVRSFVSVATGVLVWGFAYLAGLQLAAEWGVIAFALNYIPFIGPFVATRLPDAVRGRAVQVLGDGGARFRLPQSHSIPDRQLSRAQDCRQCARDLAIRRAVRGFLLDVPVGNLRGPSSGCRSRSPC